MDKLNMHTPGLVEANMDRLAELFPSVITETNDEAGDTQRAIDFDLLRQELSDHIVEGPRERFRLDWPGKRAAQFSANAPIAKALRPSREQSFDFDTTKNMLIQGDNLDALKLLQEPMLEKVKLIYIDPPYNSGSDRFVYEDDFKGTTSEYLAQSGQVDADGVRLTANPESNGRFHSDWLSMMYARLRLARSLLAPDGVMLVSIDDREQAHLRCLLDEVFGSRNFLAQLIWNKQHSQQQGLFKRYHEFVLVYARDANRVEYIRGGSGVIEAGALKKVSKANPASNFEFPAGVRFDAPDGTVIGEDFGASERVEVVSGRLVAKDGRTAEPVTLRAGWTQKNQMTSWFSGEETFDTRDQRVLEFYFNGAGKLKCTKERGRITPSTFLPKYGMSSEHSGRLQELMGAAVFDNPKPVPMLEDFIEWFTDDGDIVLDFFAGSGTTAEAAMRLSAKTGKQRPFVLVQADEVVAPGSGAEEAGYGTISEVCIERIRRSGQRILTEDASQSWNRDTGLRVFRVDVAGVTPTLAAPGELTQEELDLHVDNVRSDRSDEDLLYEVLVAWGLDPRLPVERRDLEGVRVWDVDSGAVVACFDEDLALSGLRKIASLQAMRAVFRDASFRSDAERINAEQIFSELSPGTDVKVV